MKAVFHVHSLSPTSIAFALRFPHFNLTDPLPTVHAHYICFGALRAPPVRRLPRPSPGRPSAAFARGSRAARRPPYRRRALCR